jgi:rhodanese-related sulfurtransferase
MSVFKKLFGLGASSAVAQISIADLQQKLAAKEPLQLVDVRSADEYRQDGHIAGARLIPLPALAQRLAEIPRDTPVALICRSGARSQAAADILAQAGYAAVSNVQGGMSAWERAGYATRKGK